MLAAKKKSEDVISVLLRSLETPGPAFLERIRKLQNSKYETDLLKIVHCFVDGYGSVNSERTNFSVNK